GLAAQGARLPRRGDHYGRHTQLLCRRSPRAGTVPTTRRTRKSGCDGAGCAMCRYRRRGLADWSDAVQAVVVGQRLSARTVGDMRERAQMGAVLRLIPLPAWALGFN